jgi:hypothetical protein
VKSVPRRKPVRMSKLQNLMQMAPHCPHCGSIHLQATNGLAACDHCPWKGNYYDAGIPGALSVGPRRITNGRSRCGRVRGVDAHQCARDGLYTTLRHPTTTKNPVQPLMATRGLSSHVTLCICYATSAMPSIVNSSARVNDRWMLPSPPNPLA